MVKTPNTFPNTRYN